MVIPWNAETIARLSAAILGCSATPVLIGVAYARWTKRIRKELPQWRNGLGLASMIILSTLWLFLSIRLILLSFNGDLTLHGTDSIWMELEWLVPAYYAYAALPLAFSLKRAPRLLMIAAWVLTQLYCSAFMYT